MPRLPALPPFYRISGATDYVHQVARVMQTANRHTYQVLTKRSERLRDLLLAWEEKGTGGNRENGEERVVSLFALLPPVPIGFKRTPAGEPHHLYDCAPSCHTNPTRE